MPRNLLTHPSRIAEEIDALAAITDPDRPYTRRAFTPIFLKGRDYLVRRFREAGLETRIDAAGNLIGFRPGRKPGLGTIMLGSHSDTVPDGGRFDGIAGISAALEVARALADRRTVMPADKQLPASIRRARLAQRTRIVLGVLMVAALAYRLLRYFR